MRHMGLQEVDEVLDARLLSRIIGIGAGKAYDGYTKKVCDICVARIFFFTRDHSSPIFRELEQNVFLQRIHLRQVIGEKAGKR